MIYNKIALICLIISITVDIAFAAVKQKVYFSAEELAINNSQMVATGGVVIKSSDYEVVADSFIADIADNRKLKAMGNVKVNSAEWGKINAASIDIDLETIYTRFVLLARSPSVQWAWRRPFRVYSAPL